MTRFRHIAPALAILAAAMGTSTVAIGDPGLADVRGHHHYVVQPNGERTEVGPRVCEDPSLQPAFNQFHNNGHIGSRGLNNDKGGEVVFGGFC